MRGFHGGATMLAAGISAALLASPAMAQAGDSLPAGVTTAMVSEGAAVFRGPGMCMVCHGQDGKGSIGPNLTDASWLHSKGTYEEIVRQVTTGVTAKESTTGVPMPPKGGSSISEAQVKAVAAYVWSLSHQTGK